MRKKQWILLLVVLAAFVAATAGMRGYQNKQDKKEAQKEEAEKVYALQFSSGDVTGIAYEKMVSGWHLQKTMLHGTVSRTRRQLLTVTR